MIDLKAFRKANNLKQDDIAAFLGTSRVFITLLENGRSKLPTDKLHKLLNNDRGWDTSALTTHHGDVNIGSWNNGDAKVSLTTNATSDEALKLALLEQENSLLKERLKDKDAEIAFLKSLLSK